MIAEIVLMRRLTPHEAVHHINADPLDNALDNLSVMPRGDHTREHQGRRTLLWWCLNCDRPRLSRRAARTRGLRRFCSQRCSAQARRGSALYLRPGSQVADYVRSGWVTWR